MNDTTLGATETLEFYAPFAHIPGRYEAARIHSPEYGSFDVFIVIHNGIDAPVSVYVSSDPGERFMSERFPESSCYRVADGDLYLRGTQDGRNVRVSLCAPVGPIREADIVFTAESDARPTPAPYGGHDLAVWGGGLTCRGMDLNLAARARGYLVLARGSERRLDEAAIVALGSMGVLAPRKPAASASESE